MSLKYEPASEPEAPLPSNPHPQPPETRPPNSRGASLTLQPLHTPSERDQPTFFQGLELRCTSPESGDLRYESRRSKRRFPPPLRPRGRARPERSCTTDADTSASSKINGSNSKMAPTKECWWSPAGCDMSNEGGLVFPGAASLVLPPSVSPQNYFHV